MRARCGASGWTMRSISTAAAWSITSSPIPEVSVHLESGDEVVVIDGRAERVNDQGVRTVMAEAINTKYAWDWSPDQFPAPFVVRPKRAFGWCSDPTGRDKGKLFAESGTRWTF